MKGSIAGSLNSLLVLEAAVRCGGFSLAAKELNLTQPAVSRHVATLEARLGQALFVRANNKLTVTEVGQKLADAVSLGFGHVDKAWQEIAAPQDHGNIVLACSYGFADQWLMPRFSDLRATMRGVIVRVVTSDRLEDLDFGRVDAAVVWDLSRTPERPSIPLIPDETFPVCSPTFYENHLATHKLTPPSNETLLDFNLLSADDYLHFSVGNSGFCTWQSWFTLTGLPIPPFGQSTPYDAYPFLMQAVLNGEGVALGWRGLVDQLLEDGRLLRCGPSVSNRETSYFLQYRRMAGENRVLQQLVAWFEKEAVEKVGAHCQRSEHR